MSSTQRPGRTAPSFVRALCDYDPVQPPASGRNLLSQVPPVFPEYYIGPPEYISPSACAHDYVTKPKQTLVPEPERRSSANPPKVSAVCRKCRYHLQLVVRAVPRLGQHSQNSPNHLHHLVYKTEERDTTPKGQDVETYEFECSYLTCSTVVSVRLTSPVLSHEWVQLLTDPQVIQQRAEEVFAVERERLEGLAMPQPISVLDTLGAYLHNSLSAADKSKSIAASNKRFITCFGLDGVPCKDLLEFLGFSIKNEGFWEPPRTSPWTEHPYRDQLKIFLDDVLQEIAILKEQRPVLEKKGHQAEYQGDPAPCDLLRALDAADYPNAARSNEFQLAPAPYYDDLGTVDDMSSVAIVEAFNRQVAIDPARSPLYLKCLKEIGQLRNGDDAAVIEQAVTRAYAEGRFTEEDVVDAYKYFGLAHVNPRLTEDSIIGTFNAYLNSTTTAQEAESRRQMRIIGESRHSERIKSVADDSVTNVEQAQDYLGVTSETADDFIISLFTAKVEDAPSNRDLARRALELIAQARNSDALKHFLKTGEMTAGEMDIGDAYRLLRIDNRTVDDDLIEAAYTCCVVEDPSKIETYNQALQIIGKHKNSSFLSNKATGMGTGSDRNLSEWPVGLQNIGNTCYLNSLLQFYFSVQGYRDMILHFEEYSMELSDENLSRKKVGSRKVTRKEVERSQQFVKELRTLFSEMITSPFPYVTPSQELARLTLIGTSNEEAIRRRSTISTYRPTAALGELEGMPILGPLGPPQPTPEEKSHNTVISDMEAAQQRTTTDKAQQPHNDDKENEPPLDSTMEDAQKVTPEPSSNPASAERPVVASQPPPVPPRPAPVIDPQRLLQEELEIGAQQDVTEVINNVLFQSQCAIRPIAYSADGEQIDQVKDLFYGKTTYYLRSEQGVRPMEEWWCDIKVDVASGPRNIYAALDGAFDVQKVNVDNTIAERFGTISKLPPVLQIQVQRVQFDHTTKRSFKSTHHLGLEETIYFDRYMDTKSPELMGKRQQSWEWKATLKSLEARQSELLHGTEDDKVDTAALFNEASRILADIESIAEDTDFADDGELPVEAGQDADSAKVPDSSETTIDVDTEKLRAKLDRLSQLARAELTSVQDEIRKTQAMIAEQFIEHKDEAYRLYAVFIHQGSVEFGHYYIYIFDFDRNVWRKYNDQDVTEVHNVDEIFREQGQLNPPTPYFLVYVNDRMKHDLVNPVRRELLEMAPENGFPAMEEVTHTAPSAEDVDMNPPSYDTIWADQSISGTGADYPMKEERDPIDADNSTHPDLRDVAW
ncbi:ubiquitin-specific protease UBP2 [Aspergillus homomorphus CBS 101889]|uniref:ubiquitinyl hydrolase 1 n=1 Tax=Aspergillus homomorphus (strain CBS 101889) TaxID=1450537 RepID=A0A395HKY7_ASPHC|nr:ubiquitin carboxyl-terminal hydrolase [Aspergillus homomorphus CBS 101889]RAL08083.1 ubiquitin carboxyl-terminal hydrolase [Aspergillus homomorphus CBS 101889]